MKQTIEYLTINAPVITITFIATVGLCCAYSYLAKSSERKRALAKLIEVPINKDQFTAKRFNEEQHQLKIKRLMKIHVIDEDKAEELQVELDNQMVVMKRRAQKEVDKINARTLAEL